MGTFGELQLSLQLLVRVGKVPLVSQELLEYLRSSSGAGLEEKNDVNETLIERFKSDSVYPTPISGTRRIYMFQ